MKKIALALAAFSATIGTAAGAHQRDYGIAFDNYGSCQAATHWEFWDTKRASQGTDQSIGDMMDFYNAHFYCVQIGDKYYMVRGS